VNQFPRDHLKRLSEPAPDSWIIPLTFACFVIGLYSIIVTLYLGLTP
jgi:hypothetical protein